ncbi:unnamed protein product [Ilex paraguariensis]|uniref:Uncharacterized protein n=1 Tax=Ilex paraguariensis TaxID=185542 RepID=A0ABC8S627_9AQUA
MVHKDPESAMKLGLSFEYKTDELVIPSPDKPLINADPPIATEFGLQSQWSPPRSVTNFGDFGMLLFFQSTRDEYLIVILILWFIGFIC